MGSRRDYQPTNNSKHAYLPEQVSVADGNLVITAENKPAGRIALSLGRSDQQSRSSDSALGSAGEAADHARHVAGDLAVGDGVEVSLAERRRDRHHGEQG